MQQAFDILDRWDSGEFDFVSIPIRSRLYSLMPIAMQSADRESLTSFICRLARAHMVSPRRLIKTIFAEVSADIHALSYNSFFVRYIGTANGLGVYSRAFSRAANHLTGRDDLHLLTMLAWENVLPVNGEGLLAKHPRWCPNCFEKQLATIGECYFPLIWTIELYRYCTVHHVPLANRCSCCGKHQPFLSRHPDISRCAYCNQSLIIENERSNAISSVSQKDNDALWMERALESMISRQEYTAQQGHADRFHAALRVLVEQHSKGNRAQFCRDIGWNIWALNEWLNKGKRPSLPKLLEIAHKCKVDPIELCTSSDFTLSHPIIDLEMRANNVNLPKRSMRPQLTDENRLSLHDKLQSVLESSATVPPLNVVAMQSGLKRSAVKYWFPELAKNICSRSRIAQIARFNEARQKRQSILLEIIKTLKVQGIYPSRRKVDARLKVHGLALARPELARFYRKCMCEKDFK